MSRVFWDTNLFVYLVEDRGERAEQVAALRRRMIERGDELLTSALTLGGSCGRLSSMLRPECPQREK